MKQCKICLNDKTVKHIKFNSDGICNFCEKYLSEYDKWHDFENLKKTFDKKIENIKGKYTYDVCIPFSGGKDSTYVLYKMIKDYDLKIKTFTLDNGFLSDEAKEKINKLVKELNVEHEYIRIDEKLMKDIYHYMVGKYLSPCLACSYMGYALMINYTTKFDAGLCIHGRSRQQMFRGYSEDSKDTFKPFLDVALIDSKDINLDEIYSNILSKVDKYIDKNLASRMKDALLKDVKNKDYREFVGYFIYHDYNLDEVLDIITNNTSWKAKEEFEHFDCLIHNGAKYLKDLIARRPHSLPEISYLIRDKKITKEEGIKILESDVTKYPEQEINLMCSFMNLSKRKLLFKAKLYSKRWW